MHPSATVPPGKAGQFRPYTFVDYATQAYVAMVGLLILAFHNSTLPAWPRLALIHGGVMVLIHLLIQGHARQQAPGPVLDFLRHFYPVILYTGFYRESGALNRLFQPHYLDPVVIGWEQTLFGCQPSVLLMHHLPYLALSELLYAAYFSYYVMIVGVGLALFLQRRESFFHYLSVVSFVFYSCYVAYIFLPVIGPRVFFREVAGYSLPADIQALAVIDTYPEPVTRGLFFRIMDIIYRLFEAPGAAFPSSHVAVAVCTLSFSWRYLPRIRWIHLAAVVLLCLATVYCRYHYVVDVLAGLLTAAVLMPLGNALFRRFQSPR